ncbi:MAG: hypothetical protein EOS11_08970 [Mesorhizobium sp.]|nr:MAG: hypothetical protein EOS11_08970 [Mesorhizobium sp.]TIN10156.1 MAG: hypothetical protein E5Y14_12430 [Mesorhizobium sp.]
MCNAMLGFAALAITACQSAPETPRPTVEPALGPGPIPAQTASDPAAVPSGSAIIDQSVAVTPPAKTVPAKYAAFSGLWAGRLEGMYDAKLAVQTISSNGKVTVTYAWGTLGDNHPGEAAGVGRIVGTTLKLERLPSGADVSFVMRPDRTLAGTVRLAGQTYTGAFVKQ